jgi:uncharacterized protein YmfQ (DUF2313 family)
LSLIDRYYEQAKKLLPPGLIWAISSGSRLAATLWMTAAQLTATHLRAEKLTVESSPLTSSELINEWEDFAGIPDECGRGVKAATLVERQEAVVEKLTGRGSLSLARFYELARRMGYEILIREYRPFTCGLSVCGGFDVLGARNARLYWRVIVTGPRAHWFRVGRNRCGDRLGWASLATDLECFFKRRKPAHTEPIFEYLEY